MFRVVVMFVLLCLFWLCIWLCAGGMNCMQASLFYLHTTRHERERVSLRAISPGSLGDPIQRSRQWDRHSSCPGHHRRNTITFTCNWLCHGFNAGESSFLYLMPPCHLIRWIFAPFVTLTYFISIPNADWMSHETVLHHEMSSDCPTVSWISNNNMRSKRWVLLFVKSLC